MALFSRATAPTARALPSTVLWTMPSAMPTSRAWYLISSTTPLVARLWPGCVPAVQDACSRCRLWNGGQHLRMLSATCQEGRVCIVAQLRGASARQASHGRRGSRESDLLPHTRIVPRRSPSATRTTTSRTRSCSLRPRAATLARWAGRHGHLTAVQGGAMKTAVAATASSATAQKQY